MAGVFANDDKLAAAFLAAAAAEGEGAWRMPLAPGFDKLIKSRIADVANVGGRPAGSVTAAQFLQRFVREGTPMVCLLDAKNRGQCVEGRETLGVRRFEVTADHDDGIVSLVLLHKGRFEQLTGKSGNASVSKGDGADGIVGVKWYVPHGDVSLPKTPR